MFTWNARLPILLASLLTVGQALVARAATPLPPSGLVATASSETSVVLTWTDNSTNENQFRIERSNSPDTGFTQIAKTKANVKTYTNTALLPATRYYYRVYAFRRNNPPSAYTNVAFATTLGRDSIPPAIPTGLAATPVSCSRIDLRWNPSFDGGTGIAGYEISRGGSVIAHTTTASYSSEGLPASTGFTFNVAAFDNAGNYSAMSPAVATATPSCSSNQPPTADAGPDRSTPTLASLSFNGTGSSDADGTVVSWSWSFGDGSTASGLNVNHLWSAPGTYSIVLTVTDNTGATGSDTASVVVSNRAPSANAGPDLSGTTGTALTFSGSSSSDMDGSIVSYSWSFGDGATASGMNATHAYATSGSFSAILTTIDNLGAQGTDATLVTIAAAATIPSAPSGLTATAVSSSRIDLAWTDSSGNETGFKVERASTAIGPWTLLTTTAANATSWSNTGLAAASTWFYRVKATNAVGDSAPSNIDSASTSDIAPTAPSSLTATAVSSSRIDLAWTDNSGNETGFEVERASASTGPWTLLTTTAANATSWSNTGLAAASTWFYRVKATNAAGDSAPSNVDSASTSDIAPAAPSSLTATAVSSSRIDLAWTDNSGNETGFEVERASVSTGPWTLLATTAANATSWSNTGLAAASTWFYRVKATNAAGDSASSNVDSASTSDIAPTAPSSLTATAVSSSRIDLAWTDNSGNETGFEVERASVSTGPWTLLATTAANATSWSNTGLAAASTWFYRVKATNAAGDSASSNVDSASTSDIAPTAPSSLTATAVSSSRIDLSWTDNSGNETGFEVERASVSTGPWTLLATTAANATSWSNTGLAAASTWFYRVKATNAAGDSAPSNVDSASTSDVAPAPPSSLTATAVSSSRIDLAWADNSGNETGFEVERASVSTGPWTLLATTAANATSWSNTGLAAASTWFYRVKATNAAGDSAPSNVDSASTSDVAPAAPSSLTATAVSSSRIDLAWTDNSGNETGFEVERASASTGPWTPLATTAANTTSWSNTGLAAASTWFYRVKATNAAGDSASSNVDSATTADNPPAAPSSLSATGVSQSQINVSWTDSSSNETSFKIERASASTGPWTLLATMGANTTAWSNSGLAASTTWYYRVKASNGAGDSAPSPTASATTQAVAPVLPAAPTNLSASAASTSQITLGWTDNATTETGFKVERATASAGPFTQIATPGANATSYTDSGLTANTTYYYRVRATNGTADSSFSNTANATTQGGSSDTTAPSVPAGVLTTPPSCGGIDIAWSASTDTGGSGIRGYKVYRKSAFVTEVSATTLSFLDTSLPPATYFYYYIAAVDNAGNESAKSVATGTYTLSCMGNGGDYDWDRHSGGDIMPDDGLAITADAAGNTYVTGDFSLTAHFGQGTLSSTGGRDAFIVKYEEDGTLLWAKRFGGAYDDFGEGIAVDNSGNVFVTGKFQGSSDLGNGMTSAGGYDIFLAKFNGADGRVLWSKRIGGTGADEGAAIALDSHGDIAITGQFYGTVDFGAGAVTNASSYVQAFVAKYRGDDGTHLWSRRLGKLLATAPTSVGSGRSVSVDPLDNVVIAGYFGGPVDFGAGVLTSAGMMDVFVAKYAGIDGRHVWAKRFGDANDQHAMGVATDSSGNVLLTGDFMSAIDFGGGALTPSPSTQTIFLAKLASADGSHSWSRSFVATGLNVGSYGWAVATDGSDNVLMTGQMSGPVDLGGGPLSNVGGVFVSKYGPTGVHQWSKNFRGGGGQGRGIAVGLGGETVLTGSFDTVQDFGGGDVRSGGNTGTDLFILCLGR